MLSIIKNIIQIKIITYYSKELNIVHLHLKDHIQNKLLHSLGFDCKRVHSYLHFCKPYELSFLKYKRIKEAYRSFISKLILTSAFQVDIVKSTNDKSICSITIYLNKTFIGFFGIFRCCTYSKIVIMTVSIFP